MTTCLLPDAHDLLEDAPLVLGHHDDGVGAVLVLLQTRLHGPPVGNLRQVSGLSASSCGLVGYGSTRYRRRGVLPPTTTWSGRWADAKSFLQGGRAATPTQPRPRSRSVVYSLLQEQRFTRKVIYSKVIPKVKYFDFSFSVQ